MCLSLAAESGSVGLCVVMHGSGRVPSGRDARVCLLRSVSSSCSWWCSSSWCSSSCSCSAVREVGDVRYVTRVRSASQAGLDRSHQESGGLEAAVTSAGLFDGGPPTAFPWVGVAGVVPSLGGRLARARRSGGPAPAPKSVACARGRAGSSGRCASPWVPSDEGAAPDGPSQHHDARRTPGTGRGHPLRRVGPPEACSDRCSCAAGSAARGGDRSAAGPAAP